MMWVLGREDRRRRRSRWKGEMVGFGSEWNLVSYNQGCLIW